MDYNNLPGNSPASSKSFSSDYFLDTVPSKKDSTQSQKILRASFQKPNCPQLQETVIKNSNQCIEKKVRNCGISEELANDERRKFLEEKRRQLLRENNHELRELEAKLRTAYVAKSLKYQIIEKEALRKQEALLKKEEDIILQKSIQHYEEMIKLENERKAKLKECLRNDLQEQINLVKTEKLKIYEEFAREKKILDEITSKLHEEQLEEMRLELEKKAKYKSDIDEFIRVREIWREQRRLEMLEEDERIRKYFEERESYIKELNQRRQQDIEIKEQIAERIGQEIASVTKAKLQQEEILHELYAAEKTVEEEEQYRKQVENRIRNKIQLRKDLIKHREEILERKKREHEEDKIFYEEQMRILAERDKIDQLSDAKRRVKVLEHRKELQKCLEEKKIQRAIEIARLVKEREKEIEEEKSRQQLIEEERINLLREHVKNLFGFLPPGILKETDREFLELPEK